MAAANALIESPDAFNLFRQLTAVVDVARRDVPVQLIGNAAVLNPLLNLWLEDEDAASRVVQLIVRKREERGLPPVGDADFNRRAYMRELMAQKRERGRRLVTLFNELRSEDDRLVGPARTEFERYHANRWYEVKTAREDALRDALDRRLTADEMRNISSQLWEAVDQELNELEEFVRTELRKSFHQRATNGFKFRLVL